MKEVNYSIEKPASYILVGVVGIACSLFGLTYFFSQAEGEIIRQILILLVFAFFLVLSIVLILTKINFRIVVDKNRTYIRNWLRIEKEYNTSELKVVVVRPRKRGHLRFYLFLNEKKVAKVYENDKNVGLLTNFKIINKS